MRENEVKSSAYDYDSSPPTPTLSYSSKCDNEKGSNVDKCRAVVQFLNYQIRNVHE